MKAMNEKTRKILKIVNVAFLFVATGMIIYSIAHAKSGHFTASFFIDLFALLSAALYCLYGYKKDAALFYKIFIWIFVLAKLMRTISNCDYPKADNMLFTTIAFGSVLVLAVAQDLGKRKSVAMGSIAFTMDLLFVVKMLMRRSTMFEPAVHMVLSIILCLMILAKYDDKARRGTK